VEEFDPDPFMAALTEHGLPWHELHDIDLELCRGIPPNAIHPSQMDIEYPFAV